MPAYKPTDWLPLTGDSFGPTFQISSFWPRNTAVPTRYLSIQKGERNVVLDFKDASPDLGSYQW